MSDSLRRAVLDEVRRQRRKQQRQDNPARTLAVFLRASLVNLNLSPEAFASKLGLEPELTAAILDGFLPESELDDALLHQIARVIQHEPNTLLLLLGRPVEPSQDWSAGTSDTVKA